MKNYKATLVIHTFAGKQTREIIIKAKTLESATKKAWQIAGNQSVDSLVVLPA